MKVCFVENVGSNLDYSKFELIIAVTPMAMFELEIRNLKYLRLDELFPDELKKPELEEKYFREQIFCFKDIDTTINDLLPKDLKSQYNYAMTYAYFLKIASDTVVYYTVVVKHLVIKYKVNYIEYHKLQNDSPLFNSNLEFNQNCLSNILLDLHENCGYKYHLKESIPNVKTLHKINVYSLLKYKIKKKYVLTDLLIYLSNLIKIIFPIIFSYKKLKVKSTVLFLQSGYDIKTPYLLLRLRNKIFRSFSQDEKVFKVKNAFYKQVEMVHPKHYEQINYTKIADILLNKEYFSYNKIIDVKLPSLYKYIYHNFVMTILPEILKYSEFWDKFLTENKIDAMISANIFYIKDFVALSIAKKRNIKTIGWKHGDDIFYSEIVSIMEYQFFNHYVVNNQVDQGKITGLYKKHNIKGKVFNIGSNRLNEKNNKYLQGGSSGNNILYIPGIMWGDEELFNANDIRYTKYYSFQKDLVDFAQGMKNINFIFKYHSRDRERNPISKYIKLRNVDNVTVRYDSLAQYLQNVKLIIIDYPSTVLFEALQYKTPIVYFHNNDYVLDDAALKILRENIFVVNDFIHLKNIIHDSMVREDFMINYSNERCLQNIG